MKNLIVALSVFAVLAGSAPAIAGPCRDAHGKFVKCKTTPAKPTRCRDGKGKFVKCGTKGAKPV